MRPFSVTEFQACGARLREPQGNHAARSAGGGQGAGVGGQAWCAPALLPTRDPYLPPPAGQAHLSTLTSHRSSLMRPGSTSLEQLLVLSLLGLLASLSLLGGAPLLEAAAVETASRESTALFALARDHALSAGERTAVHVDGTRGRVVVHAGPDTLAMADFAQRGVHVTATRDSMAYAPDGLGVGAANLRLVLSRGARADTINVSRLGRVEWR